MAEDITIVIPTHERHQYLSRILDYYVSQRPDCPIIVCDSSKDEFKDRDKFNGVRYLHFPNGDFSYKLREGLECVQSRYCVMCADDDFIVPSAIEKCVSFLDSHSDYSSVQGKYVSFVYKPKIELRQMYVRNYDIAVSSQFPGKRIVQQFNPYMHQFYSVHRIENLLATFGYAFDSRLNGNLIELLIAMIAALNGKHEILPMFYSARERLPFSAGATSDSVEMIDASPEYKHEYNSLLEIVTNHLKLKGQLDYEDARECVLKAMDTYLNIFIPEMRTKRGEIKTFIKHIIPDLMLPTVRLIHRQLRHFIGLDYSRKDFDRYFTQFGTEGKRNLDTILQFVKKHNIRPSDSVENI
ncbi:TIGR00180 family glycosyltransferase [Thermodesulfobacteriota bacterium]